jgi:hypothetical protein
LVWPCGPFFLGRDNALTSGVVASSERQDAGWCFMAAVCREERRPVGFQKSDTFRLGPALPAAASWALYVVRQLLDPYLDQFDGAGTKSSYFGCHGCQGGTTPRAASMES